MKTVAKNILKEKETQTGNVPVSSDLSKTTGEHIAEKRVVNVPVKDASGANLPDSAASKTQELETEKTVSPAKKKKMQEKLFVEYAGRQIAVDDVIESAKAHYKALFAKENGALKTIEVYVKPDENVAYYVANGKGGNKYKVGL